MPNTMDENFVAIFSHSCVPQNIESGNEATLALHAVAGMIAWSF